MTCLDRWTAHTPMSDPGQQAQAIAAFPDEVGHLAGIVQGLLVHSSWLADYGLDASKLGPSARQTLPIAERLADIMQRDDRPLAQARPADRRSVGTCRDFALMLCAFLRSKGVPARVRCGFASYFSAEWEDHWICEYRDGGTGEWRLADAQIDAMLRRRKHIEFDAADMPRSAFLMAGEAWLTCRRGEAEPASFGHGGTIGLWFLKINVLRDHLVLNDRETSEWDRWREAPEASRQVPPDELAWLDDLAARPYQSLVARKPDWLA
ncbi:transglutaminase domain-containing protein [Sinorhizobium sp. B11]